MCAWPNAITMGMFQTGRMTFMLLKPAWVLSNECFHTTICVANVSKGRRTAEILIHGQLNRCEQFHKNNFDRMCSARNAKNAPKQVELVAFRIGNACMPIGQSAQIQCNCAFGRQGGTGDEPWAIGESQPVDRLNVSLYRTDQWSGRYVFGLDFRECVW